MITALKEISHNKLNLWLNYLLVAYAFLLPIDDYARSFLFTLMLVLIVIRGNFKEYFLPIFKNPVVIAFVLFFFIYLVSLFWTDNIKEGIGLVKRVEYALYLPLFLSFLDKRFSLSIISAFLGGMFVSELISYSIHFEIIPNELYWHGIALYRSYAIDDPSPFLHHSHYGMALALSISILAYWILSEAVSTRYRMIWLLFIITMTINISITGGRIGYLLYVILLFLSLYFALGKKMLIPAFGVAIAIASITIIAYASSSIFQKRIHETIDSYQIFIDNPMDFRSSMGYRIGLWHYSKNVILEHPLIGVGIGDGLDETRQHIVAKDNFLKSMPHFHNQYIEVLVGTGVIGLIVFLNIFVQIFRFRHDDDKLYPIMILTTVAIAFSLLTETFHMKFYFSLWTVILAATMATQFRIEDKGNKGVPEMKIYVGLIIVAFVVGKLQ